MCVCACVCIFYFSISVDRIMMKCGDPVRMGSETWVSCSSDTTLFTGITITRADGTAVGYCKPSSCIIYTKFKTDYGFRNSILTVKSMRPEVDYGTWKCTEGHFSAPATCNITSEWNTLYSRVVVEVIAMSIVVVAATVVIVVVAVVHVIIVILAIWVVVVVVEVVVVVVVVVVE